MTDLLCVIGGFVLIAGLFVGGFAAGFNANEDSWRAEMVKRGQAEWVMANPKTGRVEWRWKEKP